MDSSVASPSVFRHSIAIGLLTLAQLIVPPLVAAGLLFCEAWLLEVPLNTPFVLFGALVMVLSAALLPIKQAPAQQAMVPRRQLALRISVRWLVVLFLLLAVGYVTRSSDRFARRLVLSWAVATPALLIFVGLILRDALLRELSDPANARRAVFVGCNDISLALAERLAANSATGLIVDGFFDDRSSGRLGSFGRMQRHGGLDEIVEYVKRHAIDVIFVALPVSHLSRVRKLLEDLHDTTASVYYAPTIFPFDAIQSGTSAFMGIPLIALCETPFHGYRGIGKRITDLVLAASILLPALPLMLLVAVLIRTTSPGPALFKQRRYGLDGREIIVYKFRTMTVMQDGNDVPQATWHDSRITPLGRLLRRTSIDELPQLINVLQGRMSLVGPRPHAVAHNEHYRKLIKGYMVRHKVAPGITGLAQVNGLRGETRDLKQMEARVRYDLEYLRNWSPLLDLKILFKTLAIVIRSDRAW